MCLPALAAIPAFSAGVSGALGTISSVAGLLGTGISAVGSIIQGNQQAKAAEANADLARQKEIDALRRGSTEEGQQRTKYQRFIGTQRAAMGASGVALDTGSSGDVLAETAELGERDAQQIRVNAAREAWGYSVERQNFKSQAKQARASGYIQSAGTLLSGAENFFRPKPKWQGWWPNTSSSTPLYGTGGTYNFGG